MLIVSIPGRQPALRMRVWRRLKALGVATLRDGVYLAPTRATLRAELGARAEEVIAAGGAATLLDVSVRHADFLPLFDRSAEYESCVEAIGTAARALRKSPAGARSTVERLRRTFDAIVERDFFPGSSRERARSALDELHALAQRLVEPGEPHAGHGRIRRLDRNAYRGRVWATRTRPWIDRLASAWLIKRFIDPRARFQWLSNPRRRPSGVVGFDFDGAEFSHVDDKVTYEVLMHSFALQGDPALQWLGSIVHCLDVGGLPLAEARTVETALRGMRRRARDDDHFLATASLLFDDLYAGHAQETAS
jgi:hypothetical protein